MSATSVNLIEVRDLKQTLSGQEILRGVNLDIPRGETLVLLGQSGGGKSVFLRHLIGLMRPISGSIRIEALFDSMDVFENVAFPLRERGERNEKIIRDKVARSLELVLLQGQERKMPVNLSGGMRKRAALARAIISEPSCILYDEPTAGLDPIVSDTINRLIRRLQSHLHVTSIVVTHDMTSTDHVADHVALLREGRIHFTGSLASLHSSTDQVITDFIEGRSHEID